MRTIVLALVLVLFAAPASNGGGFLALLAIKASQRIERRAIENEILRDRAALLRIERLQREQDLFLGQSGRRCPPAQSLQRSRRY